MADIFISYARPTETTAKALAEGLRAAGISVWIDAELHAGRAYADEIAEQLDAARGIIAVWSEAAVQSHWVRSEADRARQNGTLIQCIIDDARLPMPFDQIQCLDLRSWNGDLSAPSWAKLLNDVGQMLGRPRAASKPVAAAIPSVAVLPFKDLSAALDQDYFCEGMGEELLNALARLPGLRVAGSAAMGSSGGNPLETARALGVGSFVEGSVRRAGERTRIGVRLVKTADGFTLWSDSFERNLTDIFAVQDEITRAIVVALGVKLLAKNDASLGTGGTSNATAHDLYLRARQLVRKELEAENRAAVELFREATQHDPGFALAFAGLADVLAQIARHRMSGWEVVAEQAVAAALRAIELAPDFAEGHLSLGAALRLSRDPGARGAFDRALALSPHDPAVHYRFARFLVVEGDKRGAIDHYERAFALAPDDYRYIVFALQEYQALGDGAGEQSCLTRSAAAIERHLALNLDDVRAYGHGAGVMALLGNIGEAQRFIDKALALRPDDYSNLVTLACAAMLANHADQALDLLERAVDTGRGDREWVMADNDLKPLHGHPRFEELMQRMA